MDWPSRIKARQGPLYLAISELIAQDIGTGILRPGEKLPPHRELAYKLGVTIGTVARAYNDATERGLVVGEVGRGTFVTENVERTSETTHLVVQDDADRAEVIDLGLNLSASGECETMFRDTLDKLGEQIDCNSILRYQPAAGMHAHRVAAAAWLSRFGFKPDCQSVVICNGGQHGVFLSLMAVASHGDSIVTEPLTYPGAKAAAQQLNLNLIGSAMDSSGLIPEALREICRLRHPKAIYTMPVLQNPTTVTATQERLEEIAEIAREYDLWIIEDDVYGFLEPVRPSPLAAIAPERTIYISSASKCMAPGLRVGFLHVPERLLHTIQDLAAMTNWMSSPLLVEIVALWISNGNADHLVSWHRIQARMRQDIARKVLGDHLHAPPLSSYHLWLPLPETWRMDTFATAALREGIRVITADAFAVKRDHAPHAVRLCLGAAFSTQQIEAALLKLVGLIDNPPRQRMDLEMIL